METRKPFSAIDYIKKQSENIEMFNQKHQERSKELITRINRAKKEILDLQK